MVEGIMGEGTICWVKQVVDFTYDCDADDIAGNKKPTVFSILCALSSAPKKAFVSLPPVTMRRVNAMVGRPKPLYEKRSNTESSSFKASSPPARKTDSEIVALPIASTCLSRPDLPATTFWL
jgi:hypothetical protein